LGGGIVWEGDVESLSIGQDLNSKGLGFLENLSNKWCIAISLLLVCRIDMEWNLAATLSATRVALSAAVHANATKAGRGVDLVDWSSVWGVDLEAWDTIKAVLLHAAEFLSTRGNRSLLVTAALATSNQTAERTVNRDHLSVRVEFLQRHGSR